MRRSVWVRFFLLFVIAAHLIGAKVSDKKKFSQLEDGPQKLTRATAILKKYTNAPKSENTRGDAEFAQALEYLQGKTAEFEKSLAKDEMARLTSDIPGARADVSGMTFKSVKCEKVEYESLKKEISLEVLGPYGMNMSLLAGLYEDRRRPLYFEKMIQYTNSKACLHKSCRDLTEVYRLLVTILKSSQTDIDQAIARVETELKQLWKTAAIAKQQADRIGRRWPHCMGAANMDLGDFVKLDVTKARGEYIFLEYKKLGLKTKTAFDQAEIRFVPDNFLKNSHQDGWGNAFGVEYSEGKIKIVSAGPDMVFGTPDDIPIVGD